MSGVQLLLSDARGIYIPRDFYQGFDLQAWNVDSMSDIQDLDSPKNEYYWDVWSSVENNAFFIDKDGNKWVLYQDGDLWALCIDLMTNEEKKEFSID